MMPRRGHTLIELLVVMTATGAIMAATIVLLHLVLQVGNEVRQRTHTVATVGRLAEQFRRDVHQARGEPIVAADHHAAELRLPGGRVVKWRIDEQSGLIRTEQAGGSVGAPSANHEDSFALPKGTTAVLEVQPQGAARIVTMRIDSPGTGGPSLAIEALASRDERAVVEEEKP